MSLLASLTEPVVVEPDTLTFCKNVAFEVADKLVTIPVVAFNVVAVVIPENIALPSTLILAPTPGLAPTSIPSLAVIKPTESIFVTSSYVSVPPIVTLPL